MTARSGVSPGFVNRAVRKRAAERGVRRVYTGQSRGVNLSRVPEYECVTCPFPCSDPSQGLIDVNPLSCSFLCSKGLKF